MPSQHPERSTLESFMDAALDRDSALEVIRHLLTDCPECRAVTAQHWGGPIADSALAGHSDPSLTVARAYDAIVDRAFARALELGARLSHERAKSHALVAEIKRHPHARARTLLRNSPRFWTMGLCETLLEESFAGRFDNPEHTRDLAILAADAAEHLDESAYGVLAIHDIRGRAWAYVGNAQRILGDHQAAGQSLQLAASLLRQGSGDPLLRARLLAFWGELGRAQRRFPEAIRLFERASSLCQRGGDSHEAGIWLSGKAVALADMGEAEQATATLQAAASLLEPGRDVRIELAIRHNLVLNLNDVGRPAEAWDELTRLRPAYLKLGDAMTLIRLRWLEGKVLARLGRLQQAEHALVEARDSYVVRGLGYNAALVSLDLAALYAEEGRTAPMKRLAAEMLPIFQSLGIHREAIAALLVFQRAAEMEAVTLGLIKELATYFDRASKDPGLRFQPSR